MTFAEIAQNVIDRETAARDALILKDQENWDKLWANFGELQTQTAGRAVHIQHLEAETAALRAQLAEAKKDSAIVDWLEQHKNVTLIHAPFTCLVELWDEAYWNDRHNQSDERACDTYRQLFVHVLAEAAARSSARKEGAT